MRQHTKAGVSDPRGNSPQDERSPTSHRRARPVAIAADPHPARLRSIRRRLHAWYPRHARDLPWRRATDPYHIWVSEVMLQQTQVATVLPYYLKFIERFPTVEALAQASIDDVLRHWQGMGYYRRANNLHRAARQVVTHGGGRVPDDANGLLGLPGIGRYIAGAIQSFGFGKPAAILEANSARLLCRLFGVDGVLKSGPTLRKLWALAEALVCRESPAVHNQALMELGALICTPSRPQCESCPLLSCCEAHRLGLTAVLPKTEPRRTPIQVCDAAAVVRSKGRVLIVQRLERSRCGGLWELPRTTVAKGADQRRALRDHLRTAVGLEIDVDDAILAVKHSVTHHQVTLTCYESRLRRGVPRVRGYGASRWVRPQELADFPCSSPQRRAFRFLAELAAQSPRRAALRSA
jgi:A/G-specific adenine glycosylase